MGLYSRYILPRLLDLGARAEEATRYRQMVIPRAKGSVLEVGIGSGLNLPFYSHDIERLYGIDPSPELLRMARPKVNQVPFPVEFFNQSAEQIPLEDQSVDTVVTTWVLCSIPDVTHALREMRRVLKRDGEIIFVEHGFSPDPKVQAWQNRISPSARGLAGVVASTRKSTT